MFNLCYKYDIIHSFLLVNCLLLEHPLPPTTDRGRGRTEQGSHQKQRIPQCQWQQPFEVEGAGVIRVRGGDDAKLRPEQGLSSQGGPQRPEANPPFLVIAIMATAFT